MYSGILRYLLYAPIHWLLSIISYPMVMVLVLFQQNGWLPTWCWWFQTWDNSLDGDEGWQKEHRPFLTTPYDQLSALQLYYCRFKWLWRNPVYGFERMWLSAKEGSLTKYGEYQEGNGNVLYVSDAGYFFWNGDKPLLFGYKVNWLIGWKLTFPDRPIPICTTVRIKKI